MARTNKNKNQKDYPLPKAQYGVFGVFGYGINCAKYNLEAFRI